MWWNGNFIPWMCIKNLHQLHKGIYLIPYIILRQVTKNIKGKKRKKEGE